MPQAKMKDLHISHQGDVFDENGNVTDSFRDQVEWLIEAKAVPLNDTQAAVLIHSFGLFGYPKLSLHDIQALYEERGRSITVARLCQIRADTIHKSIMFLKKEHYSSPLVVVDVDEDGQITHASTDYHNITRVTKDGQTLIARYDTDEPTAVVKAIEQQERERYQKFDCSIVLMPTFADWWPIEHEEYSSIRYARDGLKLLITVTKKDLSAEEYVYQLGKEFPSPQLGGQIINAGRGRSERPNTIIWAMSPIVNGDSKREVTHSRIISLEHGDTLHVPLPDAYRNVFPQNKKTRHYIKKEGAYAA